jgi:hypothetical protein
MTITEVRQALNGIDTLLRPRGIKFAIVNGERIYGIYEEYPGVPKLFGSCLLLLPRKSGDPCVSLSASIPFNFTDSDVAELLTNLTGKAVPFLSNLPEIPPSIVLRESEVRAAARNGDWNQLNELVRPWMQSLPDYPPNMATFELAQV